MRIFPSFAGIVILSAVGVFCVSAHWNDTTRAAETAGNSHVITRLAEQLGQPLPESLQETLFATENQAAESKPAEAKPAESTTAESKPAESPSAETAKTEAAKPAESVAASAPSTETAKTTDTTAAAEAPKADAKPAETAPAPMKDTNVVLASAEMPVESAPAADLTLDPFTLEDIPAPANSADAAPAELPMSLDAPAPMADTGLTELPPITEPVATAPAAPVSTPAPAAAASPIPATTPAAPVVPVAASAPSNAGLPALGEKTATALPLERAPVAAPTAAAAAPATPAQDKANLGTGTPGAAALEGAQTSLLTIEKKAPEEIMVGSAAAWTITVRNEGKKDAVGVQIHDVIPKGAKLISTQPVAMQMDNGELTWNVGTMPAGTMATVRMELMPIEEGTIGSVATVSTRTEASAKAVATRPMLKVETLGSNQVLLGNPTELTIVVTNPGTGITRNVVLSEKVPPELQFAGGAELMYKVGDLRPGESRTTKLPLTAVRPGLLTNVVEAIAEPNLRVGSQFKMEVTAPSIDVQLEGPSKRFLEKEGTYKLILANNGTAPARNIELKVALPSGLKFVRANNAGSFLPQTGVIAWRLEELPAKDSAAAEFTVSPIQIGSQTMKYEAVADICTAAQGEKAVNVEGIAALLFHVTDSNDPIQVGEETTYTINVMNQGSKQAENVQVSVEIPAGLQVVSADAATTSTTKNELSFGVIPFLAPKAEKVFHLTVRGTQTGDQRLNVKISSSEFQKPIVKEESTRVYSE